MRTTHSTSMLFAALTSLTAMACAPIGHPRDDDDGASPDAGVADVDCSNPTVKTMNLTLTGSDSVGNLPSGCWQLNGSLTVSGGATSFAKLGHLTQVQDLIITGGAMTTIDTAAPLTVTRKLDIESSKLTSLANLVVPDDASCLTYLGSVTVTANPALTDLGGVAKLMCVSGPVVIQNNVELTEIRLDSAQRLEGGLKIADNTRLTSLTLANVTSITGDLVIQHNAALASFTNLAALKFFHGSVTIDDNDSLVTLPTEMVSPAPIVEGSLTVTNNAKLTELGQFDHLGGVNLTVSVSNNGALDFCEAKQIGCCVYHPGTASITGNKTTSCSTKSWCTAGTNNSCPYAY